MTHTITAMFDTRAHAQAAVEKVVAAGASRSSVKLLPDEGTSYLPSGQTSYDHTRDEGGFWGSLKEFFMPEEDRYTYAEGMSRGSVMVSVAAEDAQAERLSDVLHDAGGTVDLEEREATWRKEGWSGYSAATPVSANATTLGLTNAATQKKSNVAPTAIKAGDDEVISVLEEKLQVGKRVAESGRVRIRSYVVETPVQETISLHSEKVTIDRRPVDRVLTGADAALFQDRTIEATEHAEVAVVSKEVRVTGEVGLRKEASDRTQTISDKVRHTEVEVTDERGNVVEGGTAKTRVPV